MVSRLCGDLGHSLCITLAVKTGLKKQGLWHKLIVELAIELRYTLKK